MRFILMFKFSNRFFLFFLSAVIYHIALGQASTFTIQGEVAEGSSGAPLGFVTVMAYKSADSTRLSGTTSLEDGTFSVNSKQQNVYTTEHIEG